jgi:glutaredoxin 3
LSDLIEMSNVIVYGTRYCPYCMAATQLLNSKRVDYKYVAVDNDPELRAEIAKRSGQSTVPQIWIGEQHIGGFTDLNRLAQSDSLDNLLNA